MPRQNEQASLLISFLSHPSSTPHPHPPSSTPHPLLFYAPPFLPPLLLSSILYSSSPPSSMPHPQPPLLPPLLLTPPLFPPLLLSSLLYSSSLPSSTPPLFPPVLLLSTPPLFPHVHPSLFYPLPFPSSQSLHPPHSSYILLFSILSSFLSPAPSHYPPTSPS